MKPQTAFRLIGLAILILCIFSVPKKEGVEPLEFDSGFLEEAEKYERLIEFRDEKTNN